jgi:hypothetical protein
MNVRGSLRRLGVSAGALLVLLLAVPPFLADALPDAVSVQLAPTKSGRSYELYVVRWGYHTSIIIEQPPEWALGPPQREHARFLEYAWGDRRFFMESRYGAIFQTIFLPTEAVGYLDTMEDSPVKSRIAKEVYERRVNEDELRRLISVLEASFLRNGRSGRAAPFAVVEGYPGRFYPAPGDYLWSSDCNRWTASRLRIARLARSDRGVIFASQVGERLSGFQRVK